MPKHNKNVSDVLKTRNIEGDDRHTPRWPQHWGRCLAIDMAGKQKGRANERASNKVLLSKVVPKISEKGRLRSRLLQFYHCPVTA